MAKQATTWKRDKGEKERISVDEIGAISVPALCFHFAVLGGCALVGGIEEVICW